MPHEFNIVGNGATSPVGDPQLLRDVCTDSVGCLLRLYQAYGRHAAFANGQDRTLFAFGPEANHAVLANPEIFHISGPPGPRGSSHRLFQRGLFGLNGDAHRDQRQLLKPAMSREMVSSQAAAMSQIVEGCLDRWAVGGRMDLFAAMKDLSLAIAGRLLFGFDEFPDADDMTDTFQGWLDSFIASYFEMVLPVKAADGSYERMLEKADRLAEHFRNLIRLREAGLRDGDRDVLALLLQARRAGRIGEAEIIGQMHSMLNASYETTTAAMTWMQVLLAQHPQVQHELYRELQQPTSASYGEGSLLDGVIRESLRILPPVVLTYRRVVEATELAGVKLGFGSFVIVSYYVSHHLPEVFPDPECFRPERWRNQRYSPYAYAPFSAGPRVCMGAGFSMQLFQIAVPAILRRYRLEFQPGTRIDRHSNLTLGIQGKLPVTVLPQDGQFSAVPLTGNIHQMVQLPGSSEPLRRAA